MISLLRGAQLAQAVYSPPYTFQVGDVCANLVREGDDLALVFQGTRDIAEAIRDARAIPKKYQNLLIHGGVLDAALTIFPLVASAGVTACIGHSLGAGEAIAECALLAQYARCPLQLLAYEPLKISCNDMLRTVLPDTRLQQILTEQGNDPVTREPPTNDMFPYRHHTALLRIGRDFLNPLDAHRIENVIKALAA